MDWNALGAISELIAASAFIISFLFVGYQLKQNREMERANNQREILNTARNFFSIARSDSRILIAVSECMKNYTGATQEKKFIFTSWVVDFMLLYEQAFYMKRDGYINQASYIGFENLCLSIFVTEGGQEIWPLLKKSWGEDVSFYFEKRLKDSEGTVTKHYELMPYL